MKTPGKLDRKAMATTFLRLCATGKVDEAYRSVSSDFRQHTPCFRGDAASLKEGMADAAAKFPRTSIETQRAIEEGDAHFPLRGPGSPSSETGMEAPEKSPNETGLF